MKNTAGFVTTMCILALIKAMALNASLAQDKSSHIQYKEVKRIEIPDSFGTSGKWSAIAYEAIIRKNMKFTGFPARLCFLNEEGIAVQSCFEPVTDLFEPRQIISTPKKDLISQQRSYLYYQLVDELRIVPIFPKIYPGNGVLFISNYIGEGSGFAKLITLWVYNKQYKKFINILPIVIMSDLSEYKMFEGRGGILAGTLITANYIWDVNEIRYSPHNYRIGIYMYDKEIGMFRLLDKYVTKSKYKGLNMGETADVIRHEVKNIKRILLEN
jgi:hypothetical protein